MKLTLLKDMQENEVLAKDIITDCGRVLLKKGTIITDKVRNRIQKQGIFFAYVEDDNLKDIKDDSKLINLKKKCTSSIT